MILNQNILSYVSFDIWILKSMLTNALEKVK